MGELRKLVWRGGPRVEPKPLQPKTENQLFDIRVQYPHIQIQGANRIEKPDKELKVNPEDYPHIKINFLP